MFKQTFFNTFKNLFRCASFWLVFLVSIIITVQGAISGYYGMDSDPEFVLAYQNYIQLITNSCCSTLLMYALPIFVIITTSLILNRDFGDRFFEIEKAANISPFSYVFGRLSALLSLNSLVLVGSHILCVWLYVYTRGGVYEMATVDFIFDSFIRILRVDFFVAMPVIVFYIGIAYGIGTIFKNGIISAVASISYVIFFYAAFLMLRWRITPTYFDYFSPMPYKLRNFFHYYDTEWFSRMITNNDLSWGKALFCIGFLCAVGIIGSLISYFRIRKRTV